MSGSREKGKNQEEVRNGGRKEGGMDFAKLIEGYDRMVSIFAENLLPCWFHFHHICFVQVFFLGCIACDGMYVYFYFIKEILSVDCVSYNCTRM